MITNLTEQMERWSFQDLVRWNQGQILLAIPTGKFNDAIYLAMDMALRWKAAQLQEEKK